MKLVVHGADYPHVAGLERVVAGVDIRHLRMPTSACFKAVLAGEPLEAVEFSLANFFMLRDRGDDRYLALPVFPYRAFRHDIVYVRRDSPLRSLADLAGCRVAVPDYSMTAAVWTRGLLAERLPGVLAGLHWVLQRPQRFDIPAGVAHGYADCDAEAALHGGLADALISPDAAPDATTRSHQPLRRLTLADPDEQRRWPLEVGSFPINHVILLHRDVLQRAPQAAGALLRAFADALADYKAATGQTPLLAQATVPAADAERAFGPGIFDYGLTPANLRALQQFASYLHAQALVAAPPDVAAAFADCRAG